MHANAKEKQKKTAVANRTIYTPDLIHFATSGPEFI